MPYPTVQEYKYGEENINSKVILNFLREEARAYFCYEK